MQVHSSGGGAGPAQELQPRPWRRGEPGHKVHVLNGLQVHVLHVTPRPHVNAARHPSPSGPAVQAEARLREAGRRHPGGGVPLDRHGHSEICLISVMVGGSNFIVQTQKLKHKTNSSKVVGVRTFLK